MSGGLPPVGAGRFAGKVALVTASTEGIGFAVARRLAREGAHVVVSSRKQENVDKATDELRREGLNVSGCVCHVGQADQRERLVASAVERFGKIDIFVSNAAVNPTAEKICGMRPSAVDKLFDINVKSAIFLYQLVAPHMRPGGSVVLVSSVTGFHPAAPLGLYATCKTALFGLTKALAQEAAEEGVRVNCVAPGFVPTKFSSALTATEEMVDMLKGNTMLKRLGTSDEIASSVAFLCSNDASYVTGETLVVGGGMQSRL